MLQQRFILAEIYSILFYFIAAATMLNLCNTLMICAFTCVMYPVHQAWQCHWLHQFCLDEYYANDTATRIYFILHVRMSEVGQHR